MTNFADDPGRVRQLLVETPRGHWYVFETFASDGSLAVGIAQGESDPALVMVVYESLIQAVARDAAQGLALWYRRQGRDIALT